MRCKEHATSSFDPKSVGKKGPRPMMCNGHLRVDICRNVHCECHRFDLRSVCAMQVYHEMVVFVKTCHRVVHSPYGASVSPGCYCAGPNHQPSNAALVT